MNYPVISKEEFEKRWANHKPHQCDGGIGFHSEKGCGWDLPHPVHICDPKYPEMIEEEGTKNV